MFDGLLLKRKQLQLTFRIQLGLVPVALFTEGPNCKTPTLIVWK